MNIYTYRYTYIYTYIHILYLCGRSRHDPEPPSDAAEGGGLPEVRAAVDSALNEVGSNSRRELVGRAPLKGVV